MDPPGAEPAWAEKRSKSNCCFFGFVTERILRRIRSSQSHVARLNPTPSSARLPMDACCSGLQLHLVLVDGVQGFCRPPRPKPHGLRWLFDRSRSRTLRIRGICLGKHHCPFYAMSRTLNWDLGRRGILSGAGRVWGEALVESELGAGGCRQVLERTISGSAPGIWANLGGTERVWSVFFRLHAHQTPRFTGNLLIQYPPTPFFVRFFATDGAFCLLPPNYFSIFGTPKRPNPFFVGFSEPEMEKSQN